MSVSRTIALLSAASIASACSSAPGPSPGANADAASAADDAASPIDAGVQADAEPAADTGTEDAGRVRTAALPTWDARGGMPNGTGRWGTRLTYVPDEDRFILFGGDLYPAAGPTGDTWSLGRDGSWTQLQPTGDVPPARYCHCMTYLPSTHQILLVGGRDDNGPLPPAAFTLDLSTNTWTAIAGNLPSGVIGCSIGWLPSLGKAVVFGGGSRTVSNETWLYDPAARSFTRDRPAHSPGGRADAISAVDAEGGRFYIFAGGVLVIPPYRYQRDLWVYDGTDWSQITSTSTAPSERRYGASGFDPLGHKMLLWGGTNDRVDYDDLWSFDPATSTWAQLAEPSAKPTGRGFMASSYDPIADAILVLGGMTQDFAAKADGWSLSLH